MMCSRCCKYRLFIMEGEEVSQNQYKHAVNTIRWVVKTLFIVKQTFHFMAKILLIVSEYWFFFF